MKLPLFLASLCLAVSGAAQAAIINGGFEAGNLQPGWEAEPGGSDLAQVFTNASGILPFEGPYLARLYTPGGIAGTDPDCIGCGSSRSAIESFLGLSANQLTTGSSSTVPTEGSAIRQNISANAGDVLSFHWRFGTEEEIDPTGANTFDDFAFLTLVDNTTNIVTLVRLPGGDAYAAALSSAGAPAGQRWLPAWQTYTLALPSTGTYRLGFGVVNVGTSDSNDFTSTLVVDAVQLDAGTPTGSDSVPEPASWVLSGLGVGALAWRRQRKA